MSIGNENLPSHSYVYPFLYVYMLLRFAFLYVAQVHQVAWKANSTELTLQNGNRTVQSWTPE